MLISETAKLAGVNIETIRYYERQGILEVPHKRESGYREYTQEAVALIQFVKNAQNLGFSLKEIKGLLAVKVDPQSDCGDVKQRALEKILEIEEKITALEAMKGSLEIITKRCSGKGPVSGCTILNAMEHEETR
ncbi:MAG: heavy metal-responsive transcriptional regulator [Fibrobacterales bacterium]